MQNTRISMKNSEGKEYKLEYKRESVQQKERMGFSIEEVSKKPMLMFPLMFRGAFLKNCRWVKEKEIKELYEKMKKKDELHSALMNMINECYESLMDSEENSEGNVDWEIV